MELRNVSGIDFDKDKHEEAVFALRHTIKTPLNFRQKIIEEHCGNLIDKAKNVLEIGCGCGRNAQFFSNKEYNTEHIKYYGIDTSETSLKYFYNNSYYKLSKDLYYTTKELDETILSIKYDLIFTCYTLQHIGINKDVGAYTSIELTEKLLKNLKTNGYWISYEHRIGQNRWNPKEWLEACFHASEYEVKYHDSVFLDGCDKPKHVLMIVKKNKKRTSK